MKPRHRRGTWVAALLLAGWTWCAHAQAQLGPEVRRLDPPRPVASANRIEVLEFFYYGCPVCYETQPLLSRWLITAPQSVAMRRVPAVSSEHPNYEAFAKLFYTLEALGQIERLHWPIYDNFHFDGIKLNEPEVMADWVARNGVDRRKFLDTYASAAVQANVVRARDLMNEYGVQGVPSFVVDGKYLTSARLAGGTKQLIQVLDRLVKQAQSERPR